MARQYFCWRVCLTFGCGCVEYTPTQHVCGVSRDGCSAWMTMKRTDKKCEVHRAKTRALSQPSSDESPADSPSSSSSSSSLSSHSSSSAPPSSSASSLEALEEGYFFDHGPGGPGMEEGCWVRCPPGGGEPRVPGEYEYGGGGNGALQAGGCEVVGVRTPGQEEGAPRELNGLAVGGEEAQAKMTREGYYLVRRGV